MQVLAYTCLRAVGQARRKVCHLQALAVGLARALPRGLALARVQVLVLAVGLALHGMDQMEHRQSHQTDQIHPDLHFGLHQMYSFTPAQPHKILSSHS